MQSKTALGRFIEEMRLRLLRWEQISRLPTERFNDVLLECIRDGWRVVYEYRSFDAWVDYGRIDLKSGRSRLRFEWTAWFEGEISGPRPALLALARRYGLPSPMRPY